MCICEAKKMEKKKKEMLFDGLFMNQFVIFNMKSRFHSGWEFQKCIKHEEGLPTSMATGYAARGILGVMVQNEFPPALLVTFVYSAWISQEGFEACSDEHF